MPHWLDSVKADVVCLQEIKAMPEQFDQTLFNEIGYDCYIHSANKKGYSGVAILSKIKPQNVEYGCGINEIDFEGRVIRADYKDFSVMSVYFPSGSSGDLRQEFKFKFLDLFATYIHNLRNKTPNLIICGDFNICHKPIDIHNPVRNKNTSGFLPEEREWVDKFIKHGYVDSFRAFNQQPDQFTWWSYRFNVRAKNIGWRIDYFFVTEDLMEKVKGSFITPEVMGSDHCPIGLDIKAK